MSRIKVIALALISISWLLPLYLAWSSYLDFITLELYPRLQGKASLVNSFPFLAFSEKMAMLSCIWLAVTILIWSVLGAKKLLTVS